MIKKSLSTLVIFLISVVVLISLILWLRIEKKPQQLTKINSITHPDVSIEKQQKVEEWMNTFNANPKIPSFSAAISINGELLWAGASGYIDINNEILADTNSVYRIGSVSKPITATALMRLQENNTLNIDRSFHEYVTNYPNNDNFTLKQLATHQAGIRHYPKGIAFYKENFSNTEYIDTKSATKIIENDALLYSPGSNFQYSTYGYTLLSLAMESAVNTSFEKIMEKEIFQKLSMTSTGLERATINENRAVPYIGLKGEILKAPQTNLSYKFAGGGITSTPTDLIKFGNALLENKLISNKSKEQLWTPIPLDDGKMNPENYGLGFRVHEDDLGTFVHHGGKSVGGYTYFVIYPEINAVVALTTNITPMGFLFDRHLEAKKLINIFKD